MHHRNHCFLKHIELKKYILFKKKLHERKTPIHTFIKKNVIVKSLNSAMIIFLFRWVLQLQSRRVGRAYDGGTCFKLPWKPEHSRRWVNNM